MQSPTEISADGTYWLRSRDVSDSPAIGGDGYFSKHDVARAADLTTDDLPPADDETVRELDREALEEELVIGKWQVTGSAERIERLWPKLVADAVDERIWAAKAMTETGYEELPYDEYVLTVYTPNYFERHDVSRVREHLRETYGVTRELYYKPDLYTRKGIGPGNAEEFGLSMPARYCE